MPDTHITLYVQKDEPDDPDGWKRCTKDGADTDFWCKYEGGNYPANDPVPPPGGPGYFQTVTPNDNVPFHANITLVADEIWTPAPTAHGFKITGVDITYVPPGPSDPQLSVVGAGPTQRTIIDKNTVPGQKGTYTVIVAFKDEPPNGLETDDLHCDPGWRNN